MVSVSEIKAELDSVKLIVTNVAGDVDSLIAQVAALKEQIASGSVATAQDLEEIFASATSIKETLAGLDAKEPVA